jgi:protein SCO1/2
VLQETSSAADKVKETAMSKTIAIAASAALGALIIGSVIVTTTMAPSDRFADCRTSRIAGTVDGTFTLMNVEGETVSETDVITKPSLIYFGYTFCPDVCPLDVARNAEAVDILKEQGYELQPVFISIDPERDTPEIVGDFASNMHPDMIGLTGTPQQVKASIKNRMEILTTIWSIIPPLVIWFIQKTALSSFLIARYVLIKLQSS